MVRTGVVLVAMSVLVVGTWAQQRIAFKAASARVVLDMNVPTSADFKFSNLVTEHLRAVAWARERSGLSSTGVTDDRPPATATTLRAVEKLGLRLQRLRVPVDVVVVDSLHRQPTEN